MSTPPSPPGEDSGKSLVRRVEHDWASDDLGTTIFMALDSLSGFEVDASEDILFGQVDPDALGSLFEPVEDAARTEGEVRFPVDSYEVSVGADGTVEIYAGEPN